MIDVTKILIIILLFFCTYVQWQKEKGERKRRGIGKERREKGKGK